MIENDIQCWYFSCDLMIEYKHFRPSSYPIFLYAKWSRFMMVAVLNRDWRIIYCLDFTE